MDSKNVNEVARLRTEIERLRAGLIEIAALGGEPFRQSIRVRELYVESMGCLHVSKCLREDLPMTGARVAGRGGVSSEGQEGTTMRSGDRTGAQRIAYERARQVEEEGWTPRHDDEHEKGELSLVAALYATPVDLLKVVADGDGSPGIHFVDPWPASWSRAWDKRLRRRGGTSARRIRELEKAGALVAAEIDRLLRLTK